MTLDDILSLVFIEAPSVPEFTARQQIMLAAREFCDETYAWQQVEEAETEEGSADVELFAPGGSEVVAVVSVAGLERGKDYTQPTPSMLRLAVPATSSHSMQIMLALKPRIQSSTLPDDLKPYIETLAKGAVYRLTSMAGVEWSNPQAAQSNYIQWQAAIAEARQRSQTGRAFGARTVKPRRFI